MFYTYQVLDINTVYLSYLHGNDFYYWTKVTGRAELKEVSYSQWPYLFFFTDAICLFYRIRTDVL